VWAHSDATIDALALGDTGRVEWWGADAVPLFNVLVHVLAETSRHAGHADILRELVDGAAGFLVGRSNLPDDGYDWPAYVARVERAARDAADRA
jgi:hypothetical protein